MGSLAEISQTVLFLQGKLSHDPVVQTNGPVEWSLDLLVSYFC